MKPHFLWVVGVALAATLFATPSFAQDSSSFDSLGAAIKLQRYQTDFKIGTGTYNATVDELGLAFRQYFGHDFSLAIEAGYTDLSMDGNPSQLNLSPHGYYGLITARYQWWFTGHFGLDVTGTGGYHRLSDSSGASNVVDRWWSYSAAVGPRFRWHWLNVGAGVVYRHASGDEQASSFSGKRSLDFARTTSPYLDVDFTVSPHGTFGLHFEGGARRSVALVFGYRFVSP